VVAPKPSMGGTAFPYCVAITAAGYVFFRGRNIANR
jgi:hypothetical protein